MDRDVPSPLASAFPQLKWCAPDEDGGNDDLSYFLEMTPPPPGREAAASTTVRPACCPALLLSTAVMLETGRGLLDTLSIISQHSLSVSRGSSVWTPAAQRQLRIAEAAA